VTAEGQGARRPAARRRCPPHNAGKYLKWLHLCNVVNCQLHVLASIRLIRGQDLVLGWPHAADGDSCWQLKMIVRSPVLGRKHRILSGGLQNGSRFCCGLWQAIRRDRSHYRGNSKIIWTGQQDSAQFDHIHREPAISTNHRQPAPAPNALHIDSEQLEGTIGQFSS